MIQDVSVDGTVDVVDLSVRRRVAVAALVSLRPRQWTKNLLLFAGILFAEELGDRTRWAQAVAAFVVYCAASSAAYLVNDVVDRDADRAHPVKRYRPIARGELSIRAALTLAALLLGCAFALAVPLGPVFVAMLVSFLTLQGAYSAWLKHVVVIDVLVIAALFVVRAAAGAEAVDVEISPWLLLCTGLLALFLALGKRRGELALVAAQDTPGRRVLDGYSIEVVDQLIGIVASATIASYALYTFTARDSDSLMITIPFVLFGILRYVLVLHSREGGEEPESVLLRDRSIMITVALWALTCAVVTALD